MLKVLNLYAGIGGNRKLWEDVEVTAIEIEPKIAEIYQDFFPNDKVIVTDAHQFLLEHFDEFDFIWSSPPCPTHSKVRFMGSKSKHPITNVQLEKKYPDMDLYQEIIFLDNYFNGKWVVENVIGYYEPLIKPQKVGMHYFWSNFHIGNFKLKTRHHNSTIKEMQKAKGFDLSHFDLSDLTTSHKKDLLLRNCVEPKLGLHILQYAFKVKQTTIKELNSLLSEKEITEQSSETLMARVEGEKPVESPSENNNERRKNNFIKVIIGEQKQGMSYMGLHSLDKHIKDEAWKKINKKQGLGDDK